MSLKLVLCVTWLQDEELIKFFADAAVEAPELMGAVEAVRLVRDKTTNVGKGIAFVMFRTKVRVGGHTRS